MADNVSGLPGRGQTLLSGAGRTLAATGQAEKLEGILKEFNDRDSTSTARVKPLRSQAKVVMRLVRNVSGIALLPKRLCVWKTGKRYRQVNGYSYDDHAETAGVVDECLPSAGVPNNDLFWLAVKGPHLVRTAMEGNVLNYMNEGDVLTSLTAVTSQSTTAGVCRALLVNGMTATTTQAVSICLNNIGRALTARTTANTAGTTVGFTLVDLDIMK